MNSRQLRPYTGGNNARWAYGLITAAVLSLATAPAAAHNGEVEYIAEINGYYVEVADDTAPDTGLFYTLYLRDLDRGLPIDDASVEITARSETKEVGPTTAVRLANAYSIIIPDDGEKEWTVDVRIDHEPRGLTTFTHTMPGVGAIDAGPWWTSTPILVFVWVLPLIGVYILHRAGRRRPETATLPDAKDPR